MNVDQKMVAALGLGGVFGDLTDAEEWALFDRGHAQLIRSTGRWVLTDAGVQEARQIEAELSAEELAEMFG